MENSRQTGTTAGYGLYQGQGPQLLKRQSLLKDNVYELAVLPECTDKKWKDRVLFEICETVEEYEKMEEDMKYFYCNLRNSDDMLIPYDYRPRNGELAAYYGDVVGKLLSKRVQLLSTPIHQVPGYATVEVKFVDYDYEAVVDFKEIYFLDRKFTELPVRFCDVKLYELTSYTEQFHYRDFINNTIMWGGKLSAEVVDLNQVVVWNDKFPREKFPLGINGFILENLIKIMGEPKLPFPGFSRAGAKILHADDKGNVYLVFRSAILEHLDSLLKRSQSTVVTAISRRRKYYDSLVEEDILLVPRSSTGLYERAVCLNSDYSSESIFVKFIDSGVESNVAKSNVILAKIINPAIAMLPPLAVKAHLQNVVQLDVEKFMNTFGVNSYFSISTVNSLSEIYGEDVMHVIRVIQERPLRNIVLNQKIGNGYGKLSIEGFLHDHAAANLVYDSRMNHYNSSMCLDWYTLIPSDHQVGRGIKMVVQINDIPNSNSLPTSFLYFARPLSLVPKFYKFEKEIQLDANRFCFKPIAYAFQAYDSVLGQSYLMYLCFSAVLNKFVRCFVYPWQNSSDESDIRVYCMDYGISEKIRLTNLYALDPRLAVRPAYGCRLKVLSTARLEPLEPNSCLEQTVIAKQVCTDKLGCIIIAEIVND